VSRATNTRVSQDLIVSMCHVLLIHVCHIRDICSERDLCMQWKRPTYQVCRSLSLHT